MIATSRGPRPTSRSRAAAAALVLLAAGGGLAACGDDAATPGASAASSSISVEGATVIDVRTPEEFAAGHLDGATNIDVSAGDFDQRIDGLDPAGSYVVYCRSGNRSAQAVARMREAGFADVVDAGGLDAASSATGLDVVTD